MTTADEILAGNWLDVDAPEDGSEAEPLAVDSIEDADRVGRAIRAIEADVARKTAMVMEQRASLAAWLAENTLDLVRRGEYLRSVLERFHFAQQERLGGRAPKTIHLPSGDLVMRAIPLSIDVTNREAAVDALLDLNMDDCINRPPPTSPKPDLVRVKRKAERKQRVDGSWGMAVFDKPPGSPEGFVLGVDYVLDDDEGWWWFLPGLDASPPHDRVTFRPNVAPEAGGEDFAL